MPARKSAGKRPRHGSRKLIETIFQGEAPGRALSTAELFRRVSKLAGRPVPQHSVRSALRTLVRRKSLRPRRSGREMYYSTSAPAPAPEVTAKAAAAPAIEPAAPSTVTVEVAPPSPTPAPSLPHKLAVGESLVLHVGQEHVEAVTNVHGKLVVERHPRPKGRAK